MERGKRNNALLTNKNFYIMTHKIYFLIIALCIGTAASYVQAADFSPNTITVSAAGGTITVNITAGLKEKWTVSKKNAHDSWITLPKLASGIGSGSIQITIAKNTTASPRVGILTFADSSGTFTITQAASAAFTITKHPDNLSVPAGGTATFSVTATGATSYQWQVDTGGGWGNMSDGVKTSGTKTATFTYSNVRTIDNGWLFRCAVSNGTETLYSNAATLTVEYIPVTGVSLDKSNITLSIGQTANLTAILTPSDAYEKGVKWSSSNPAVAKLNFLEGSYYEFTMKPVITAVGTGPAVIFVETYDGSFRAACIVFVTAAPTSTLSLSKTSETRTYVGGAIWVDVTSNTTWNAVSSDPSWLYITSGAPGNLNGGFYLRCEANTSTALRTATVTVSTTDGTVSKTFTVYQYGTDTYYIVSPASLDFTASAGSKKFDIIPEVTFIYTSQMVAESDEAWATVSPSSGFYFDDGPTLTVTVEANPLPTERTAIITVKSSNTYTLYYARTVTVKQAGNLATTAALSIKSDNTTVASISGTGVDPQPVSITQSNTVANETIALDGAGPVSTWVQNGVLHVSGLTVGESYRVYNILGTLVASPNLSEGGEFVLPLPARGIYIVTNGNKAIKVVN